MASSKAPRKILCKYFMSNCCFKGDLCPFSHDWKHQPDMVCQFYLKGACVNGKNCRYDHVRPKEVGAATTGPLPPVQGHRSAKMVVPEPANLPSLASIAQAITSHDQHVAPRRMVTLRDDPSRNPKKWVQAAAFVPGKLFHGSPSASTEDTPSTEDNGRRDAGLIQGSYSDALGVNTGGYMDTISAEEAASLLCPFAEMGHCPFEVCDYLHGDVCDMCNRQCLNPFDPEQQKAHRKDCLEMHEREMEKAFQIQGSEGKQCAVCMESVIGKFNKSERRFGILVNCDHCFCLGCIRRWRGSTTASKTIRACPLCRVVSFFVIPSEVWIEDEKQKQKLLQEYKDNLGKKHCKYFNMGEGTCPFGTSCFYKHEYPDGRKAEEMLRFIEGAEGDRKAVKTSTLWDYMDNREEETLDSLPQVTSTPVHSQQTPLSNQQEEVWLNYEPDIDDLEFL